MLPRFKYYDLQGLTPEEKHAEQKKRWLTRQMQDPEKAEKIRAKGRTNKQAQCQRAKLLKNNLDQGAAPPRFRRQRPLEALCVQHVSHPIPFNDHIIDPVLHNVPPPRQTADAVVMTDPPPQHLADATRHLSPPDLDLISDILGIQVLQQSGSVTWADGRRTVLPCIMSRGIDICEDNDAAMVRFLSEFLESKPTSDNVAHIEHNGMSRGLLQQAISEALRHNKPVLIHGSNINDAPLLDAEYLDNNFGISPLMRVTIHAFPPDVTKRVRDFTHPHKTGTIQQFLNDIDNPSKIQCILDLPLSHMGLPQELHLLDHGLIYGWNQTTVDCPVRSGKVHPDNFTTKSWALLHHAVFVTYPHHDADGAVMFVRIKIGIKFWVVFCPIHKLSHTALQKGQMLFADFAKNWEEIKLTWRAEVITLLEGDLLFQPAGQVHAVYTPKKSFVTGGKFFNYGSLHLTEISRYINAKKVHFLTNQVHESALETFQRMTIALPRLSPSIELYHRAVVGLCLMVINHHKYIASNNDHGYIIASSESTERAVSIATAILRQFYKDMATAQRVYRSGDQSDPGDLISREDLSTCLRSFSSFAT
ncbi:uncharacterized protein F5891DRAFT_1189361 [Suillus fuscotomentosus]|uniref:JmjC domain-containing protein n=1 Tax=Suillus fuscotomentosus TaxID=1912939 RepID=A0AAD4E5D3_9AGAM|nr:uncharacterized protein F5891DRAFT_1189361 [Suillus fuscotomentosus]KAG1899885.1 hypothetical protein F5891DRAFT_1189361 [Suillus fuscotomentosus]